VTQENRNTVKKIPEQSERQYIGKLEAKINTPKSLSFWEIFRAFSAVGIIFGAFSVGILVESRFHIKSEQLSEVSKKLEAKESEINKLGIEMNQLNIENITN
jgi:hypothetical protein